jgi:hypothetical protein
MAGPEAGEKKGRLGKAEMLKTETLTGRILRRTPESWRNQEDSQLFSFVASVVFQTAMPRILFDCGCLSVC